MTHDRWGEVKLLPKVQVPNPYGLGVKVFGYQINELLSDKGVCGTALTVPGLLIANTK